MALAGFRADNPAYQEQLDRAGSFAALESLLSFCAGCYVYTFYVRLFPKAA